MDVALNDYLLHEHTSQIKDINDRLHKFSNLHVKEQQALDQVELNLDRVELNLGIITDKLEKTIDRLNSLENESIKKSFFKENAKYIPVIVLILALIDYNKIIDLFPTLLTAIKAHL